MAATDRVGKKKISASSFASLDPADATASCLENFLQIVAISDETVIIENEFERHGLYRQFVKLKKSHWVDPKQRRICKRCMVEFRSKIKKFNCRRCGEVFCESCCSFRRRLTPNCDPSADGHYYRVCYDCSDVQIQASGPTRSLTAYFESQKNCKRINLLKEMLRLLEGFKANVKISRLDSVVKETISTVKVPVWQMSEKWLESKEVDWCGQCSAKFTMFMQKHHCRLCGAVFCHKCCKQDLMLYYTDQGFVEWAVICVVGCPDSEPSVCLYLKVCSQCREDAENMQVRRFYNMQANSEEMKVTFGTLSSILDQLRSYQQKINRDLLYYQEMVEGSMDGKGKFKEVSESGENIVNVFAKLQMDVADLFSQYVVSLYELKKIKMATKKEMKLLRNILTVHFNYYNSNMSTFKCFKENLNRTLPASMLREVQDLSDEQSINSACITTYRLGIELLHLCDKYKLELEITQRIGELDKSCKEDLEAYIKAKGEDWQDHSACLKKLVEQMLSSGRLIVPSKHLLGTKDNSELVHLMKLRCLHILLQVQEQLLAKSSETKFIKAKTALRDVIENLG